MIVNISNAPVVIGRFRILPGNKFPDVPKTSEETLAVAKLVKKGILKESMPKADVPATPVKQEQPAGSEKQQPEAEAPKKQGKSAKDETSKPETANVDGK